MEIKDSGERREFSTGAVRDVVDGKGRCDLLPLGVIGDLIADDVLLNMEKYIRTGEKQFLRDVLNIFLITHFDGEWYDLFLDVSKHYEEGAKKYEERNWERGIPLHSYIDSAVRHYFQFRQGKNEEPHGRAFVWNILGALWTQENRPEMIDLPFESR